MKADTHSVPGVLTPRQTQKAATRRRVLDAARELFDSEGYVETTIRKIALQARVSVGTVFTGFASKGDILSQVMEERLDGLYDAYSRTIPHLSGDVGDRLKSLFASSFAFEAPRMKLFLAHIAAAYDWTLPASAKPFGKTERVRSVFRDMLADGVARGELDQACDVDEVCELLLGAYAWTYRLAAWENADAATLSQAMNRQIDLIMQGLKPRA